LITFRPDSKTVYVSLAEPSRCPPIDCGAMKEITRIPVERCPTGSAHWCYLKFVIRPSVGDAELLAVTQEFELANV